MLATIRISSTLPAARASAHSPSRASGSRTSCTQRGTTTGGGDMATGLSSSWGGCNAVRGPVGSRSSRVGSPVVAGASGFAVRLVGVGPPIPVRTLGANRVLGRRLGGRCARTDPETHTTRQYEPRATMNKSAKILFIGDIVGGLGKRALLQLLPELRERFAAHVRGRQRREHRRRLRDHAQAGRPAVHGRRRRDHPRQPHLPPARDLRLPRRRTTGSCARPTSCAPSRATAGAW